MTDMLAVQTAMNVQLCHECAALLDLYLVALLPGLVSSGQALSKVGSSMLKWEGRTFSTL